MKILIVTPRVPFPPYRGDKLKIYNIVRFLMKDNDVKIISIDHENGDTDAAAELGKRGIEIELVKLSKISSYVKVAFSLFTKIPFQVAYYKSIKLSKKLFNITNTENFDLIYFHLIRTSQYIKNISPNSKAKKVLDFTDAVSLFLERYTEQIKNPVRKLFFKSELNRVIKYEKIAKKFDKVFVCSETDKNHLGRIHGINDIGIMTNGVDLETFKPQNVNPQTDRIIFTGNMPYYANYDAALFFAREIFPLVLKRKPNAMFYIVGQNPPKCIKNLSCSNIIVTGFVEDITIEYLKSMVNIAPIRFGAGTLNKIIESLILGVPVVATSMATSGLPKFISNHIHIADAPQDFAQKLIDVLDNNVDERNSLNNSRAELVEQLDWNNILQDFENDLIALHKNVDSI